MRTCSTRAVCFRPYVRSYIFIDLNENFSQSKTKIVLCCVPKSDFTVEKSTRVCVNIIISLEFFLLFLSAIEKRKKERKKSKEIQRTDSPMTSTKPRQSDFNCFVHNHDDKKC